MLRVSGIWSRQAKVGRESRELEGGNRARTLLEMEEINFIRKVCRATWLLSPSSHKTRCHCPALICVYV